MVERGDATPEDVDQAMQLGAGMRELYCCVEGIELTNETSKLWV